MRGVLVRLLIAAAGVLVLVVLCIQIVLTTDTPRRLVIDALEGRTGLEVHASSVSTGWRGASILRDVTLTIPLSAEPIAHIPVMRISHSSLPVILAGGFTLHSAELVRPRLTLDRAEDGEWNIARALRIMNHRARLRPAAGEFRLPRLAIGDALILLPGEDTPLPVRLDFSGDARSSLSWTFEATLGEHALARGSIAQGADWAHQLAFTLDAPEELVALVAPGIPAPIVAAGAWRGAIGPDGIAGLLQLQSARAGEVSASGEAAVEAGAGLLRLHPRALVLASDSHPDASLRVAGGALTLDDHHLRINAVRLDAFDTSLQLNASWELRRDVGEVAAAWNGQIAGISHDGTLGATIASIGRGRMSIAAEIASSGAGAPGEWETTLNISARGASLTDMTGTLTAPTARWRGRRGPVDVSGLSAAVETSWPWARITRLDLPNAGSSRLDAEVELESFGWSLAFDAGRWHVPGPPALDAGPIDLHVRASGDAARVELSELRIAADRFVAAAGGVYDPAEDPPLSLRATARYELPARIFAGESDAPGPGGTFEVRANAAGSILPLDVELQGDLIARDLRLAAGAIDQAAIAWRGHADERAAAFESDPFDLLGGEWRLDGDVDLWEDWLELHLTTEGLDIAAVAALVGSPVDLHGLASGRFDVRVPDLRPDRLDATGEVRLLGIQAPGFHAEAGSALIGIKAGVLRLSDMMLTSGDARITGTLVFDLRDRRSASLDIATRAWPVESAAADALILVDGQAALDLDLQDRTAFGRFDLRTGTHLRGRPVGHLSLLGGIDGRTIAAESLEGEFCGGRIEGRGVVPLDALRLSTASVTVEGVDLAVFGGCIGLDDDLRGSLSGSLRMAPAEEPRAPEPVRFDVFLSPGAEEGASFRAIDIGKITLTGYIGSGRAVLESSSFAIAGGTIDAWSRLSRHGSSPDQEEFLHIQADLAGLDLDQLVRAADPESEAGATPGRLSGRAAFGGYIHPPHRMFGEARLFIAESDLANLPIISQLYSILRLNIARVQPTGAGQAHLRLEGDALELTRLQYFNRGVDIIANLRMADLWKLADSPISGAAAGTVRPLRDSGRVGLPFIPDLDRLLSALQTSAASVRIGGTLAEREVRVVPFSDISDTIWRALGGRAPQR